MATTTKNADGKSPLAARPLSGRVGAVVALPPKRPLVKRCNVSRVAEECLRAAGWSPNRRVGVDDLAKDYVRLGYTFSDTLRRCLLGFNELRVHHKHAHSDLVDHFEFDARKAIASLDRSDVVEYGQLVEEELFPIGFAFRGYMVLLLSEHGKVYAVYDGIIRLVGTSVLDAVDSLCTGRELVKVSRD